MESLGIISRVKITDPPSIFTSPLVLVVKRNNSLRVCLDLRHFNDQVVPTDTDITSCQQVIDAMCLRPAKVYGAIDLFSAFYSVWSN
jgi:hypothetical protein